jgi:hypothetical protein
MGVLPVIPLQFEGNLISLYYLVIPPAFNALLGGGRDPDGHYSRRNAHGFYWAATENDTATASFCNFANGSQAIYQQQEGEKIGHFLFGA